MEMGIMGAGIGLVTLIITIFLIRKICDLIIALGFFAAVAIPYLLGSSGFPPEQTLLLALGLGVGMPVITLPLWSISKIMRGGEGSKIDKLKDKEKKDIEQLKNKFDVEINELKNELKKIKTNDKNKSLGKDNDDPLKKLESLKSKKLITEEEYEVKKKEISDRV